ncbi:MAG TPA: T9SS type A sorting domain-containing protein [Ignavibacteria bacterium]|nr:T9SS type A sorting domain-containing protein [Ignavibacteria bacterium]HMR41072.1 T9SS type A sorting domain-containing protein [Ignavibacteria bacterium]
MKKCRQKIYTAAFLILFFSVSVIIYGNDDGRTGRTLKNSTSGCGGCHGSSATSDVSVLIAGPDTVTAGQTMQFSLTISKPGKTGAGLDIATRNGTLAPVSSNIHLANGELTHNSNIQMTSGSVTVQFNYTAPGAAGTDTLWATGLATNSTGGTDGDDWNWASSKRIIVKLATGIESNNSLVNSYSLDQNFPNPFNPVTKIKYEIAEPGFVTLKVYNSFGKEVASLVNSKQNSGDHEVNFSGSELASGIYFYSITSGNFTQTRSMILLK